MKRITLLLIIIISIHSFVFAGSNKNFTDIENHWAKEFINIMLKDGSVDGYEDGLFKPDKYVTIVEFLKMLELQSNTNLVLEGNRWPDWYINTALKNEWICEDDLINMTHELTRKDACNILSKYIGVDDVLKAKNTFLNLSKENEEVILKLVKLGIIDGFKDKSFREDELVSRAQACKLILKSYDARIELNKKRVFELNRNNTNIGVYMSGDFINQRYEIDDNRIYIINNSKHNSVGKISLNQEFVNDKTVIKLVKALVDDSSYTQLRYVQDSIFLNNLNVCYGEKEGYVYNGTYTFQVRFYENGRYDPPSSTDTLGFSNSAFAKIELDRMWDKLHEYENELSASEKNLYKLENAIGALFGDNYKKEVTNYIVEKIKQAKSINNNDFEAKILESKEFGKYKLDVICTRDSIIQIYLSNK